MTGTLALRFQKNNQLLSIQLPSLMLLSLTLMTKSDSVNTNLVNHKKF